MAFNPAFKPQPFGNVTVVTPGTLVQLALNLVGLGVTAAVTDNVYCNKLSIITSPITHGGVGNTGYVYIGTATMVRATLAGVIAVLSPGQSFPITNNVSMNIYQFEKYYLDADTAGDGVYGSIDTV